VAAGTVTNRLKATTTGDGKYLYSRSEKIRMDAFLRITEDGDRHHTASSFRLQGWWICPSIACQLQVHLVSLPPYSPELNPTEAIGEELRPLCENAEAVRRLVSHPWLVEQVNATATVNSAITPSKWYKSRFGLPD
jgi:hypothetical protein